jgi:hypothetical protein
MTSGPREEALETVRRALSSSGMQVALPARMAHRLTIQEGSLRVSHVAPAGWDCRIPFPTLSTAFARAARTTGMEALFATDGDSQALILVRSAPIPLVRRWTARAKVYVSSARKGFIAALVPALRTRGVAYVRFGDAVWGGDVPADTCDGMTRLTTHLMTFDATVGEAEAMGRMDSKTRAHVRKSIRDGVVVEEILTESSLAAFCRLAEETSERMRARDVAATTPSSYFRAVFREMVPRGEAVFLLARAQGCPLAGGLFLVSRDRMSYYLGASTRDRALTARHGPTAVFWEGMRLARVRGIPTFDLGAVTPTDDPRHPHHSVYRFKRGFGGRVEAMHGAEVVFSPLSRRFQDLVLVPAWKWVSPVYFWLTAPRGSAAQTD